MRLFLVACVAALSLGGCEKSSTTSITRTQANGVDTLYSKGTVVEGGAGPGLQHRCGLRHAAAAPVRGGGGQDRSDARPAQGLPPVRQPGPDRTMPP
ncbi:hypothetical protein G6F31_016899 [Rhizopus arrhizus]|nr:hypothetical protein G6F31_016899 [Rhizopus arrhizus]